MNQESFDDLRKSIKEVGRINRRAKDIETSITTEEVWDEEWDDLLEGVDIDEELTEHELIERQSWIDHDNEIAEED